MRKLRTEILDSLPKDTQLIQNGARILKYKGPRVLVLSFHAITFPYFSTQNSVICINTISFEVYENFVYYVNVKNIIQIKNLTLSHAIN